MAEWKTIERPGYFGRHRDIKMREYDARFGEGNWRLAWKIGPIWADRLAACALYEDAYYLYMTAVNPFATHELVTVARDVYDDAPSNVASRFDYGAQETNRTHVQDIAIRRVLLRLGLWFRGTELLQIRHHDGPHPLSRTLSPGKVPFHRPDLLEPAYERPEHERWYDAGSVEDFYQRNKYLQAKT